MLAYFTTFWGYARYTENWQSHRANQVLLTTTVENYVPGKISVVSARIIPE